MRRYALLALLCALLPVVASAQGPSVIYDGPLAVPWAQLRPAPDGGHTLRWHVTHEADAWSIVVGWTEVWRSEGTFPRDTLAEASLPAGVYRPEIVALPGGRLQVCATWNRPPINGIPQGYLTQCRAVVQGFRVALPLLVH